MRGSTDEQAKEETVRGRQGGGGVNEANRIRMGECEWESLARGECSVFGISKSLSLFLLSIYLPLSFSPSPSISPGDGTALVKLLY